MYGDFHLMPSASASHMMMGGGGGGGAGAGGPIGIGSGGLDLPAGQMGDNGMMLIQAGGSSSAVALVDPFSTPNRNPSHSLASFMTGLPTFHGFIMPKEEAELMMGMGLSKDGEMELSGSASGQLDGGSGEDHDDELLFATPPSNQQAQNQALSSQPQNDLQLNGQTKKKRYHRHTPRQIQEMEALFKECPHPDDKQRLKLSQELGLRPRQVKFWFQNRRTQMKAQQDRADNALLRAENETLKGENLRLRASVRNVVCPNCGNAAVLGEVSFDEQQLRLENARLKEELERISCVVARCGHPAMLPGPPASAGLLMAPSLDLDMGVYARHFGEPPAIAAACAEMIPALAVRPPQLPGADVQGISDVPTGQLHFPVGGGVFIADQDRALVVDMAMTAAAHLLRLCREDASLWVRGGSDGGELLDMEVFQRACPWPIDLNQRQQLSGMNARIEATRDTALVIMNSITLADIFSDVNKWVEMFPSIVYNARTIQVIATGIPGQVNGSLHLMYGEFQFLSPLIPTREAYFFRFCQQNAEEGSWTVVDFPVDGPGDGFQAPFPKYRRRLSGCIIQDMPNGYSKVSWVDISEVEDKSAHQIFDPLIVSGRAFGAQTWLAVLQRQCERLASLMARNVSDLGVIPSPEARRNMMKLSHRMVRTFCANICFSSTPSWTALSDAPEDTVRISTRKSVDPGQPSGVILCAVSTTWLPCSHEEVFELLTDEQRRSQLDVLSGGNSLQEVAHIANGSHQRNCVSLLRINASSNSSQNVELVLQESSTHPTGGSFVVYANVNVNGIQLAMSGDDPSCIPLLPLGFVMVPAAAPPGFVAAPPSDSSTTPRGATHGNGKAPAVDHLGCLLTVGLQVLASAVPSAKLNLSSINAINNHLCNAVHQISSAVGCGGGGSTSGGAAISDPAAAAGAAAASNIDK